MLKLLGSALLFTGSLGLGLMRIRHMDERISVLNSLLRALNRMKQELMFRQPIMEELLILASANIEGSVAAFFSKCCMQLKKGHYDSFDLLWHSMAVQELKYLKSTDFECIKALGGVLGRFDAHGQMKAIESTCKSIEHLLYQAKDERNNHAKIYCVFGAAVGSFVVILLL